MADNENSVPVSFGFSAATIIHPCSQCRAWQMCVWKRKCPVPTGVLVIGSRIFGQEPTSVPSSRMDIHSGYCTSQSVRTIKDAVSGQTTQALPMGYGKDPGGRQRLFIHWNRAIRDIMRSHISKWIVETVKEAYTRADRDYEDQVTAHEVRALSASWAYNCQVALPDILSAAFWRLSGVFQNSYLRDMASIADGMSTLGPLVVAQHVVDPGHLLPPP